MTNSSCKYPTKWDLSCFYESIDSEKISNNKYNISNEIDKFISKYKDNLQISNLANAIIEYEEIYKSASKIAVYLGLYFQIKQKDDAVSAAYQNMMEWYTNNFSKLCWFEVEIQKMDYDEINESLKKDKILYDYKAFIDNIFKYKPHTLTSKEEFIISKLGVVTGDTWYKFHNGLLSRIVFEFKGEKLNLSDIVEKANHGESEEIRKEASIALSEGLKSNSYALTSVFNNIILSHKTYNNLRNYTYPEQKRFLEDDIEKSVVETMLEVVRDHYESISHRYYKLKAKILNKSKLQYWDRAEKVHLSKVEDKKYTYEEAIDLVLGIFKDFSPKFFEIVKTMVNEGWVDVYPREGKVSGAFSSSATVDTHPFILLNFYGSIRDILTIAHEFGHGIHQKLSAKNKELVCNPGLNISETASIFAEKLTNKYLLNTETDLKKKIELICSRLDDVMSTVFRQIAFFKFEQKIHNIRNSHELSENDLNQAWRQELEESLGNGIEIDHHIDNYWGYITHFTSCPFYVYSYAFGCLFVEGLFAEYEKNGSEFVSKYENALSSGGTKNYREIAEMFNIDPTSKEFWVSALKSIENEIDELEAICDQALFN